MITPEIILSYQELGVENKDKTKREVLKATEDLPTEHVEVEVEIGNVFKNKHKMFDIEIACYDEREIQQNVSLRRR